MFHVELDNRRWQQTVQKLAEVNRKTPQAVLRDTARQVVENAIAMTPPIPGRAGFGKGNAGVVQRTKVGKDAVARDIRKTMMPVASLRVVRSTDNRAGKYLKRYLRTGRTGAAEKMLKDLGIGGEVHAVAQRWMHEDQRFNGRVPKRGAKRFLILSSPSINQYITERQKMVWKGVSGWNKPASRLKCRARYWPAAARKLYQPGHYAESAKGSNDVWYEFANKSPYMQSKGRELNIMRSAFQGVQNRMIKDLEVKLQMAHAKANYPP